VTISGSITGILLAAGGARRFGSQKLVHLLDGVPLVRMSAMHLLASQIDETIVVVGHDATRVSAALESLPVRIVEADSWSDGMSASLRAGLAAVGADSGAIVVVLGDQPTAGPEIVDALIVRWRTDGAPIVAPSFQGEICPPVLFAREMFADIMNLRGDRGAKAIIQANDDRVSLVPIETPPPRDIDTIADIS
jgi:molybdenum cofactor cytidylyltransferase